MRAGLCIFWVFFFLSGCYAQNPPAQELKVDAVQAQTEDPYLWDFGTVKAGKPVEHEFILKNNSAQVINIAGSFTSCGCTVSQIDKKVIPVGESTGIKVQFKTVGYNGDVQQFVYVNTDDPANPVFKFTIKANVVK